MSKEYAEKTGVWSYEKLKDSTLALKELSDYEKLSTEKRYVIFCIQDNTDFTKNFLLLFPIAFTKVWIESGSIRIITEQGTEELRKTLEIEKIPSAIIKMNDGTIRNITNEEEIRTFIKNLSFYDCDIEDNTELK
jgi:hypothetical protein